MADLNSDIVKVLEILNLKLLEQFDNLNKENNEAVEVSIYEQDLEKAGISLHAFSAGLKYLQEKNNLIVTATFNPLDVQPKNIIPDDLADDPNIDSLLFEIIAPNSLISLLELHKSKEKLDNIPQGLIFDDNKSVLYIYGNKITIARHKRKTEEHKILKYIFVDHKDTLDTDFNYCDIAESENNFEYDENPNSWKKYYRACEMINKKINQDTNGKIKDFLFFSANSAGMVRINKEFLKIP